MSEALKQEPLPWWMCDRVDRWLNEGEELVDHLRIYREHNCAYAEVELKRMKALAEYGLEILEKK